MGDQKKINDIQYSTRSSSKDSIEIDPLTHWDIVDDPFTITTRSSKCQRARWCLVSPTSQRIIQEKKKQKYKQELVSVDKIKNEILSYGNEIWKDFVSGVYDIQNDIKYWWTQCPSEYNLSLSEVLYFSDSSSSCEGDRCEDFDCSKIVDYYDTSVKNIIVDVSSLISGSIYNIRIDSVEYLEELCWSFSV